MPTPAAFAQAFSIYLADQAFGICTDEVDIEQFIRIDMRRAAHATIADIRPQGEIVRARRLAHEAVAGQIAAIHVIARRVLGR